MIFEIEEFVTSPSVEQLHVCCLTKVELLAITKHFKLDIASSMRKSEIKAKIDEFFVKENMIPHSSLTELSKENSDTLKLRQMKLKFKERLKEKQYERELKLKKVILREMQLRGQYLGTMKYFSIDNI